MKIKITIFEVFIGLISLFALPHTASTIYLIFDSGIGGSLYSYSGESDYGFLAFVSPQVLAFFMAIVLDIGAIFAAHKVRVSNNGKVRFIMLIIFVVTASYSALGLLVHQDLHGGLPLNNYWQNWLSGIVDATPLFFVMTPVILGGLFMLAGVIESDVKRDLTIDNVQYDNQKQKDKAEKNTLVNHLKANKNLAIADVLKYDDSLYWYPTKTGVKVFDNPDDMLVKAKSYFSKKFGQDYIRDNPYDYDMWLNSRSGELYNG